MKITKTFKEWDQVLTGLRNVSSLKGIKFAYAVSKNLDKIILEFKVLEKLIEPSDEYKKYDKERVDMCEKYCQKDSNGKPIINNKEYVFDDMATVNKELDKLTKKYESCIKERDKKLEEFKDLYDTEVEIDIHQVKFDDVPEDISGSQYNSIACIITEPNSIKLV